MENVNGLAFRHGFGIFIVIGIMSLQLFTVCSYPLGLEARGLGIHQGQPSYLPAYNGIFSIHALNFTPAAVDKTENYIHVDNQDSILGYSSNISLQNLVVTNESPTTLTEKDEVESQPTDVLNHETDDGTAINEVDSESSKEDDAPNVIEPASFPQIQVVTKTITEETFQPFTTTTTDKPPTTEEEQGREEITTITDIPTLGESLKLTHSNESETLLSGSEDEPVEADEKQDIFDHFIEPIQSVWQDFVGKLKMSVLEVWKSISQHLMDRLESFAMAP